MKADREKVLRLLRTARGQMDGIIKMVEEDRYCIDISNQVLATGSMMDKINREIIRAHLESCVREAFAQGNEKEKLDEVMDILAKLSK